MRQLSDRELELIVGGYQAPQDQYVDTSTNSDGSVDIAAGVAASDADIQAFDNAANTMSSTDFNSYATSQAVNFGFNVAPGVTITPIYNPFSGPNSIRYGVKAKARC